MIYSGYMIKKNKIVRAKYKSMDFSDLKTIGDYGLYRAFFRCNKLAIINLSFPELVSIGNSGLYMAFNGCSNISGNVSFPKLTTIETSGMWNTFYGCLGLSGSISFPKLTTVGGSGLYGAFINCNNITALHFRSDAQSVIEESYGYNNKFGATNATIYFDL